MVMILGELHGMASERPRAFVALPEGFEGGPIGDPAMAVHDELIVRFRPVGVARRETLNREFGDRVRWLTPRRRVGLAGPAGERAVDWMAVVKLPPGTDILEAIEDFGSRPDVLYAEPNQRLKVCVEEADDSRFPSDFEFSRQWALHNSGQTGGKAGADIGALDAWRYATGSRDIVVAIIDTGVDYFHPDLEANVWSHPKEVPGNGMDDDGNGFIDDVHGYDFVSDDGDPMDDNLHGTHVAGILAAVGNDENGIAGVAWSAGIMALKAFDETGAGSLDDTISAIAYAEAAGARVINASWGTTTRSRGLDEAVAEAVRRGVVVVAAAGNNGSEVSFHPAAVPEAIAVGATDARDGSSTFSNHGSFVDLVAPGDAIHSTAPNAAWTLLSGTSMAAPHVSGVAVLLLTRRPSFTPNEIAAILGSTAVELRTDRFTGAGRVHAGRAVAISEPLPTAELRLPPRLGGVLDLLGTAGGPGFAGYVLELGVGLRPDTWTPIGAGGEPKLGGVLLTAFDTSRFDDGEYAIRLTVTNAQGQGAIQRMGVPIRNVRLESPSNNDIARAGEPLNFRGTVFGQGRSFTLSWGLGRQPSEWSASGFNLTGGGTEAVVDGVLGTWDPSVGRGEEFVTFRLEAKQDGRVVGEAYARMVHLEPRLREGWPLRMPFAEEFPEANWREFNVADLDGDGRQEVLWVEHGEPGGRRPSLEVRDGSGTAVWTRELPGGAPEFDAPVVGDVDGDGMAEVFVDTGSEGRILAFDAAGKPLGGSWPVVPGGTHFGKVLADLNGDGRMELIALSNPPGDLVGTPQRHLVVLNGDGRLLAEWSFASCTEPIEPKALELLPAVANLDGDPALEIVALDGCLGVSAFDLSHPGSPIWTSITEANLFGSPVAGDLDGDGREEIVVGGVSRGIGLPGGIHLIDADGRARPGWPALRDESFPGSLALADLDGDDRLEIVAAGWESRTVHVLGVDGFELKGWPLVPQVNAATRSVPVVGDVDGDGFPDVVLASPGFWLQVLVGGDTSRVGGVRAWRADGTVIDLHPLTPPDGLVMEAVGGSAWNRLPPAALADLDGDGKLDIVAGTIQDRAYSPTPPVAATKSRSSLYAWALDVPYRKEAMPWPLYQGGAQRSGRYVRPPKPNRPPVIQNIPDQTIATGGMFRVWSLDRYVIDPDGLRDRLVWTVRGLSALRVAIDERRQVMVEAPSREWEGSETAEFVVRDAAGGEDTEVVTFSVRAGYRPPLAQADRVVTLEEVSVELDPMANDQSPTGRRLSLGGVSAPGMGTVEVLEGGRIRYIPVPDFFGEDTFEYTLLDDDGGSAVGEVRVTVEGVPDAPIAEADRVILEEDTSGEWAPLENDWDPDGEALEWVGIDPPREGVIEMIDGGRLRFTPPADWSGLQTMLYRVRDPSGLVSTGEVAVLVRPVNDAPTLKDQAVSLNRNRAADIFYDARDADGDLLRFTIVEAPTNGVLLAYPTIANYVPKTGFSGTDRFTYTASDGRVSIGPATVTLTVGDANNPPDVESMETVTADDQELQFGLTVRDVDGDPVDIRISRPPEHGEVVLAGTNVVYRPAPGFTGMDPFGFRASDRLEESREAEVRIRVTSENTPPVARSEVLTVARNQESPIRLLATDAENNPLRFQVVIPASYGELLGDPPAITYRPRTNFRGLDRLNFQAIDRRSTSAVAVIHLLVRDPNQAPKTTNQTIWVRRDESATWDLAATDGDGHPLRLAVLKGPRFGRVSGLGSRVVYRPRAGFQGLDSFTYKVWDGFAYSGEATVSLSVMGDEDLRVRITEVRVVEGGVEMTFRGGVGRTLRVEVSFDLLRWETAARVPGGGEAVRWLDSGSGGGTGRFYRVLEEPFGAFP